MNDPNDRCIHLPCANECRRLHARFMAEEMTHLVRKATHMKANHEREREQAWQNWLHFQDVHCSCDWNREGSDRGREQGPIQQEDAA